MPKIKLDHIALLVRDIDLAVEDYKEVLGVLDPENSLEIVDEHGIEDGYKFRAATFVSKTGGIVIQFIKSEHPRDAELLKNKSECVHHVEFCSEDVEKTFSDLKAAKIPLAKESLSVSESKPWQKSINISLKKTHGLLLKVSTQYKVKKGKWEPE